VALLKITRQRQYCLGIGFLGGPLVNWNYRIIQKLDQTTGVHEVYYDEKQRINMWSEQPCLPLGESSDELKKDFELMMKALDKPTLKIEDLLDHHKRKELK